METSKAFKRLFLWALFAMLFNIGIYFFMGEKKAIQFLGGYILEQSLSLDNLFIFLMIFKSFGIESKYQNRILKYGIIGAVILRLIFIVLGVSIINRFHWMLYIFGVVLVISGIKMFVSKEENKNFKNTFLFKSIGKVVHITDRLYGEKFFVIKDKRLFATPLFAVLVLIEGSDIIFAMDSIPAIFSITTNLFIVYTSNIFAIMGLRNMYFLLDKLQKAFRLVKYGVAFILIFTGAKLLLLFINIEIPILVSLFSIFLILFFSISISTLIKE